MCIVLGNLLDNAIEATAPLPLPQRQMQGFMRTPNKTCLLQVKNPYEGKRKKVEGYYLTTKPDKELHGLGLDSVDRIVKKYNGSIKINDNGREFIVDVTIFKV